MMQQAAQQSHQCIMLQTHSDDDEEVYVSLGTFEKALKEIATNNFNSKVRGGALGNRWARSLQMDNDVNHAHGLRKGYQHQREFRAKWAAQEWQDFPAEEEDHRVQSSNPRRPTESSSRSVFSSSSRVVNGMRSRAYTSVRRRPC